MSQWIKSLGLSIIAILAPIHAVMLAVLALILLDTITGIWAAIKRDEKVTSAALRRTISKIVIYQIAIVSGFLLQQYIFGSDTIPVVKLIASAIGVVECKSILENANYINQSPLFASIVSKLGSQNDIQPATEKKDEESK